VEVELRPDPILDLPCIQGSEAMVVLGVAGKANGKGKRVGRLSANATLSSKGPSTQHQHHTRINEPRAC
jgi:hypothetical protein